ncbi:hypothetical protein CD797_16770 [Pseudomonas aeruginosa]|nr:hypothetical protein CD797_16770 [Pseudomonas aeruginosa]
MNFRHAANALGVAQSSVSARVKALEEDLGILLFERHARGVRLTEAGRHFVERIAAGIDQLDHAVKTPAWRQPRKRPASHRYPCPDPSQLPRKADRPIPRRPPRR